MSELITTFRALIAGLCGALEWPVYQWLPLDVNELPCFVVGRPDVREGTARAMAELTVPVYALGRTLRDADAQRELDLAADGLLSLLWSARTESVTLRIERIEATVLSVAALEIPAYTAAVVGATTFCP